MITKSLGYVVDVLNAAGIDASFDPQKINPPAVWVSARRLARPKLGGPADVVVDVFLITRDAGIDSAIRVLEEMLETIIEVIEDDDRLELDWQDTDLGQSVTLPQGGSPLPAYKIAITVENE